MKSDKNVYRKDLILLFAKRTGMTQKKAEEVLDTFQDIVYEFLCDKTSVYLTGFGIFRLRKINEREGRNPKTREIYPIREGYKPEFKASMVFKKAVNRKIRENEAAQTVGE